MKVEWISLILAVIFNGMDLVLKLREEIRQTRNSKQNRDPNGIGPADAL